MLLQPQPFTPEESAIAAEQFGQVYRFLAENDLPEEDYYDHALTGFLKAVRSFCRTPGGSFKKIAWTAMSKECTAFEEMQYSLPPVLSFCESDRSAYTLEETVANAKDTLEEAIMSISLQETMEGFTVIQRQIAALLYEDYSMPEIARILQIGVNAVYQEVAAIRQMLTTEPLMLAA